MNSKDYKKIAEIIKNTQCFLPIMERPNIARELANYFEEENNIHINRAVEAGQKLCKRKWNKQEIETATEGMVKFNRKRFLKDCGVEE